MSWVLVVVTSLLLIAPNADAWKCRGDSGERVLGTLEVVSVKQAKVNCVLDAKALKYFNRPFPTAKIPGCLIELKLVKGTDGRKMSDGSKPLVVYEDSQLCERKVGDKIKLTLKEEVHCCVELNEGNAEKECIMEPEPRFVRPAYLPQKSERCFTDHNWEIVHEEPQQSKDKKP